MPLSQIILHVGNFVIYDLPECGTFLLRIRPVNIPTNGFTIRKLTSPRSLHKLFPPCVKSNRYYSPAMLFSKGNSKILSNDSMVIDFKKEIKPESLQNGVEIQVDLVRFDLIDSSLKGTEVFDFLQRKTITLFPFGTSKKVQFEPLLFDAMAPFCLVEITTWISEKKVSHLVFSSLNSSSDVIINAFLNFKRKESLTTKKSAFKTRLSVLEIPYSNRLSLVPDQHHETSLTKETDFSNLFFSQQRCPGLFPNGRNKSKKESGTRSPYKSRGRHLVVFCHGYKGSPDDMLLLRNHLLLTLYLQGLEGEFDLLLTSSYARKDIRIESMAKSLKGEIDNYIRQSYGEGAAGLESVGNISFVCFSLGTLIARAALKDSKYLWPKLHSFYSLAGCHLGHSSLENSIFSSAFWMFRKMKKSPCLEDLCLEDSKERRESIVYRLSADCPLRNFRNLLLFSTTEDRYVPIESARVEVPPVWSKRLNSEVKWNTAREMVSNIIGPMAATEISRVNVVFSNPKDVMESLTGRKAHMSFIENRSFAQKLFVLYGRKLFK